MIKLTDEVKAGYRSEIGCFVKSCIGDWENTPELNKTHRKTSQRLGVDKLSTLPTLNTLDRTGLDERAYKNVLALNGVAIRYRMLIESDSFKFFMTRAQVGKNLVVSMSEESLDTDVRHGFKILNRAGAYSMSALNKYRAGADVGAYELDIASAIFGAYHGFS